MPEGRSDIDWVDFNLYGHQFVCHLNPDLGSRARSPATLIRSMAKACPCLIAAWCCGRRNGPQSPTGCGASGCEFVIEPCTRFKGQVGEQSTMFFLDPTGNALEFKAFRDFATAVRDGRASGAFQSGMAFRRTAFRASRPVTRSRPRSQDYGIEGRAAPLPSERDQNFLITDARGGKFVLKIANRDDSAELLDFQHQAMRRVAARAAASNAAARPLACRGGHRDDTSRGGNAAPAAHAHLDRGHVLAKHMPRGAALFDSIGASMAQVDLALADSHIRR